MMDRNVNDGVTGTGQSNHFGGAEHRYAVYLKHPTLCGPSNSASKTSSIPWKPAFSLIPWWHE